MRELLAALLAGTGAHLVVNPRRHRPEGPQSLAAGLRTRMNQAGLAKVSAAEAAVVVTVVALLGGLVAAALFGGTLPTVVAAGLCGAAPIGGYRSRRRRTRNAAQDAWPRLIEEVRLLTSSAGRGVPQALFQAARRAPDEMAPAFEAARREWLLSTDLERALAVLKGRLADPTADVVCETLLVAHELGGTDLDRRLAALATERRTDARHRSEARAGQAGARFARRFVLLVPVGMALAGASVGDGRAAYQSPEGQVAVALGVTAMAACWWWAARLLRLPEEQRVFTR